MLGSGSGHELGSGEENLGFRRAASQPKGNVSDSKGCRSHLLYFDLGGSIAFCVTRQMPRGKVDIPFAQPPCRKFHFLKPFGLPIIHKLTRRSTFSERTFTKLFVWLLWLK